MQCLAVNLVPRQLKSSSPLKQGVKKSNKRRGGILKCSRATAGATGYTCTKPLIINAYVKYTLPTISANT
uniref:Uncharacterized protein n=1 Tax=Glossina palpalis gambiensis TaxID=67801 RepID=A0A1B0C4P7_9MUSC